jgi:hypothetical protein
MFICGDKSFIWSRLLKAYDDARNQPMLADFSRMVSIHRYLHASPTSSKVLQPSLLWIILQIIRHRSSTDPGDKTFALHWILYQFGLSLPQAFYSKSVREVYTDR